MALLGILGYFIYFSQSKQLGENENENKSKPPELEVDEINKVKKKKKKKSYEGNEINEEDEVKDELIINQTPQQIEELHGSFINVLNTIIELNECQNDETISHGNSKENSIESIESQIQKNESLQLNEINYTNDAVEKIDENKTEQQTAQKDSYDPVAKLVEPEENYEITNLINSITVSTQGKSERGITIIGETKNDEASTSDKNLILKLHQQISVDSNRDENEEIIKSEVNIQYKQPNKLQQININDSDRYVEFDEKTNKTIFNDDFKESLEDLSYDQEEMGSKISLQTDKTIDSSIEDLAILNKQFEIFEMKNSSDEYNSDKKESSDKNSLEIINKKKDDSTSGSNSCVDEKNNNYHDESDGISNRLKEQLSINSLLSRLYFNNN